MKIIHPTTKPIRKFSLPITIYTLSRMRNNLYLAGFFFIAMGFMYATSIIARADRFQKGMDHYLVQHRYLYYVFIAVLVVVLLLPLLFPLILSNGHLVVYPDTVFISQKGAKPLQMTLNKKDIRHVSLHIPSNNSRSYIRTASYLLLEDGRRIEFDIIKSSIKNRQGIRLLYILEAAVESEGVGSFEVSR